MEDVTGRLPVAAYGANTHVFERMQKYDKSLKWKHVGGEEEQVRV